MSAAEPGPRKRSQPLPTHSTPISLNPHFPPTFTFPNYPHTTPTTTTYTLNPHPHLSPFPLSSKQTSCIEGAFPDYRRKRDNVAVA